jgi:hypothetical protein
MAIIAAATIAKVLIGSGFVPGGTAGLGDDAVGVDVGTAVSEVVGFGVAEGAMDAEGAGGADTKRWVTAEDDQYDSEPANVAVTVYIPGIGGRYASP